MTVFAIDPGVHRCALAAFRDKSQGGRLFALTDTPAWNWGPITEKCVVVLEIPRGDKDPRKTNDLIDLNGAGMFLAGQIVALAEGRATLVKKYARNSTAGRGWKGQTPKPIHHAQVLKRLDPTELAIVAGLYKPTRGGPATVEAFVASACAKLALDHNWHAWYTNKIHNPLDAVALGLTYLGRM